MASLPQREAPVIDAREALAVIVPAQNVPARLPALVECIEQEVPPPFTVYITYDPAADAARVVSGLTAGRPWLRLAPAEGGTGVVGAIRTTFRVIGQGPALVTFADAGDDLSVVPRMLGLYREGYRIVCASRFAPGGEQIGGSALKRAVLRASGLSLRWLIGFPTHDLNNNFRLYDAALVDEMGIESTEGAELALELTAKAFRRGVPIAEVPVTWTDRRGGGSAGGTAGWLSSYVRWYGYALRSGRHRRRA